MYVVDKNNVITRVSDGKIIPRDISTVDYQNFLYYQEYRINPVTGSRLNSLVNQHPSHD